MITGKHTAFYAAIFLVTINQAEAKLTSSGTRIDQFCGDRYCGHVETGFKQHRSTAHHRKHARIVRGKEKSQKSIQVASLGENPTSEAPTASGQGSQGLLSKAKSYLGTNPTGWDSLWCARFMAFLAPAVADRLKKMGLNPNWARDWAELPGTKPKGEIGDIVVLRRGRKSGHIGILMGWKNGNLLIISGNHGHKVGIGEYPKGRVIGYVTAQS